MSDSRKSITHNAWRVPFRGIASGLHAILVLEVLSRPSVGETRTEGRQQEADIPHLALVPSVDELYQNLTIVESNRAFPIRERNLTTRRRRRFDVSTELYSAQPRSPSQLERTNLRKSSQ